MKIFLRVFMILIMGIFFFALDSRNLQAVRSCGNVRPLAAPGGYGGGAGRGGGSSTITGGGRGLFPPVRIRPPLSPPRCVCNCNTCNPPACPSGTDSTDRGDICLQSRERRNCGFTCTPSGCGSASNCFSAFRSCWHFENNPAPTKPTHINVKKGKVSCDIANDIRIPYPVFVSNDGFLARGSVNNRANDSIRGHAPLLRYQYSVTTPNPDKNSPGTWSDFLGVDVRYKPSYDFVEGDRYDIYARANSVNRCEGSEFSPYICRSFTVNHIPKVLSVEVLENPNLGVSGNLDNEGRGQEKGFDCNIDNPKTFKVTFEDKDGCGDLIKDELLSTTEVCGGGLDPKLSLRAIDSDTGDEFSTSSSPYQIKCESHGVVEALFDLEFLGEEVRNLEIQAQAIDILGDTSDWVEGMSWSYDGISPFLSLNSNIIVGANELNVDWSVRDDTGGLSGVLGVRLLAHLEKGDILTRSEDYGPIVYGEDTEVSLADLLNSPGGVAFNSVVTPDEALARGLVSSVDKVNIGKNQDGFLNFELQGVDRACNYISSSDSVEFGSPWIATRGGFVHSGGSIELAIKQALYSLILDYETDEQTSLSTELVTSGSSTLSGFSESVHPFYSVLPYTDNLTHGWYDILLRRANARDPEKGFWAEVSSSQDVDLTLCENSPHVYFVDGSLDVDPSDYEVLAQGDLHGCIFVVSGDINIWDGEHKSVDVDASLEDYSPLYDIVRGYFISDSSINIKFVDGDKDVRDGLKVIGGLFATGGDTSIKLSRSLQLRDNLLFPTLIVFHDNRYMDIGRKVLGDTFGGGYIHDIGLK